MQDIMRMTYGDGDSYLSLKFDRLDPDDIAQMLEVIEINLTHTDKMLSIVIRPE